MSIYGFPANSFNASGIKTATKGYPPTDGMIESQLGARDTNRILILGGGWGIGSTNNFSTGGPIYWVGANPNPATGLPYSSYQDPTQYCFSTCAPNPRINTNKIWLVGAQNCSGISWVQVTHGAFYGNPIPGETPNGNWVCSWGGDNTIITGAGVYFPGKWDCQVGITIGGSGPYPTVPAAFKIISSDLVQTIDVTPPSFNPNVYNQFVNFQFDSKTLFGRNTAFIPYIVAGPVLKPNGIQQSQVLYFGPGWTAQYAGAG